MRVLDVVRRLRGRSLAELRERIGQSGSAWMERAGLRAVGEPTDDQFLRRLRPDAASRGLNALAQAMRSGARPAFFAGAEAPSDTAQLVAARFPERAADIVRTADAVLDGRFSLLGYPALSLGFPPRWTSDALLEVTAPDAHWSRIAFLDPAVVGDHKLVWELNRHRFLVTLAQAWQLTGERRYARGAVTLLASWLDANPPALGVNWASSLEVAFRAIAWTWAHRLLRDSSDLTDALMLRWLKAFDASGRHIERYLSTWFSPNTHLTGEALGLLYLGTQFPELRGAARWERLGWDILRAELPRHVRPDGTYFEQATHYHRYTLDIYLHARVLRGGAEPSVDTRIDGLATFLAWVSRADGTIPLFGDEDGGRLLAFDDRPVDDVRAPLATSAVLLGNGTLAAVAGPAGDELAWMLGRAGIATYDALELAPPAEHARAFPDGGFVTIRDDWTSSGAVLTIDAGPFGMGKGGHAHADTLAFDLSVGARPVFVDAGTVSYTTNLEERDRMRRSQAHNTLTLDGVSSSEPSGPFEWRHGASGVLDAWLPTPMGTILEVHHDGYLRLPAPARHRRVVIAARYGWWLVRDVIEGEGTHDASATFQCAPGLDLTTVDGALHVSDDGRPLVVLTPVGPEGTWVLEDGIASRCYGARDAARRARYCYRSTGHTAMTYAITRMGAARCDVVRHAVPVGEAIVLHGETFDDVVLFGVESEVGGVRTDARMAWVRRPAGRESIDSLVMLDGSRLEINGVTIADAVGGHVSATRGPDGWHVARLEHEARARRPQRT